MDKKLGLILLNLVIILGFISSVSAITASIGNARMILRAEVGEVIEKSVLVKNVNDVSVQINVSASGDLADYIEVHDTEFTLVAGEEKKARFTLTVGKSGTTNSKINVQFNPIEEGAGVGLSSTVIVIAGGEGEIEIEENEEENEERKEENEEENNKEKEGGNSKKIPSVIVWGMSFTAILFLIFFILLVIASRLNQKQIKRKSKLNKKRVSKRHE